MPNGETSIFYYTIISAKQTMFQSMYLLVLALFAFQLQQGNFQPKGKSMHIFFYAITIDFIII